MKKRLLSLALCLALCLGLFPFGALATGGGGIYVPPGSHTEGSGGTYTPPEDTRAEIWCVSKPDSIGRSYDGTTDGSTIPIDLTFTDGTNNIILKEGTGFTAKKTFDSADAGWHTVTVELKQTQRRFGAIHDRRLHQQGLSQADHVPFQDDLCGGRKTPSASVCRRCSGRCCGDILLYTDQIWIFGV